MTSEILSACGQTEPPRLYCDEMLLRLARWLRAAGYDTELASGAMSDRDILARAHAERRWLLTRDRGFLERRNARQHVFLFTTQVLDQQAAILRRCLRIDWLYAPFSRCLLCNTPLQALIAEPSAQEQRYCPHCRKWYWEGNHVRRMRARLQAWQQARG